MRRSKVINTRLHRRPVGKWNDTPLSQIPNRGTQRNARGLQHVRTRHRLLQLHHRHVRTLRAALLTTFEDQIEDTLTKLHERLVDISKTEWYGQYYLPAANCHFYG